MSLVKSAQRVADHGVVLARDFFTPSKTYPPMTVSELAAEPDNALEEIV